MGRPTNKNVMYYKPTNKNVRLSVGIKKDIIRFKIRNQQLVKDKKGIKDHIYVFLQKRGHEKVRRCDITRWIKEHKWIREAEGYPTGRQAQIILEEVIMAISRQQANTRKGKKDDSSEAKHQTDSDSELDDEEGEEKKDEDEYMEIVPLCPSRVSVPEIDQAPVAPISVPPQISVPQSSPPVSVPKNSAPENSGPENSMSEISLSIPEISLSVPVPELPVLLQVAQIRPPTSEPEITTIAEIPPIRSSVIKDTFMLSAIERQGWTLSPSFKDLTIFKKQLATYILRCDATQSDVYDDDDDVFIEDVIIRNPQSFVSMKSSKIQHLRNILGKAIAIRRIWRDVQARVQYRKSIYIICLSQSALLYMNVLRRIVGRNEIPFLDGYFATPRLTYEEFQRASCAMSWSTYLNEQADDNYGQK